MKRVLIRADASADWEIAGLRQLDRLALTLNEFAQKNNVGAPLQVSLQWDASLEPQNRWVPHDSRLNALQFNDDVGGEFDLVLRTNQVLSRGTLASFEVANRNESGAATRRLLRNSGKSQDGLVSRYLNRPLSRAITALLLRTRITPNEWSVSILPLLVIAAFFLRHGSYGSILFGLLLFQLFSVLDGCDGEIARAKFLESKSGQMLDDLSDVLCNVLLVFSLGLGLGRVHSWLRLEGFVAASLIGLNELLQVTQPPAESANQSNSLGETLYPRHRNLIENSGLLRLGEKFVYWLIQLTKRDVSFLLFIFLAAIQQSAWILHLLLVVNAVSLALGAKTRLRATSR